MKLVNAHNVNQRLALSVRPMAPRKSTPQSLRTSAFGNVVSSASNRLGNRKSSLVSRAATAELSDEDLCLDIPGLGGSDIDALNREYGQEGFIHFERGENGLTKAVLTHPTGAMAEVYLHGATVTRWRCSTGFEALHTPGDATYDGSSPIAAGMFPSFPQYGRAVVPGFEDIPLHGFARNMEWEVVATELDVVEDEEWEESTGVPFDPAPRIALRLRDTEATRKIWPHKFEIFYEICLGLNDDLAREAESPPPAPEAKPTPDPVFFRQQAILEEAEAQTKLQEEQAKADRVKAWVDKGFSARWNTATSDEDTRRKEMEAAAEQAAAEAEAKALEYGADQLRTVLRVFNRGDEAFKFTTGVHSMLSVLDAGNEYCRTLGLGAQTYIDTSNPTLPELKRDTLENVHFGTAPVDRLYSSIPELNESLLCPGDRTHFRVIMREGFKDLHVANPHEGRPDTWRDFVAMSPCKAVIPIKLKPNSEWSGEAVVRYYNKMWIAPIQDPSNVYDPMPEPQL